MPYINGKRVPPLTPFWRLGTSHKGQVTRPDSVVRKPVLHPLPTRRLSHLLPPTILPFIVIVVALTVAVVGTFTWAYFSSTATTTATFSSGTVKLLICDDQGQGCAPTRELPPMVDIHPGWGQQLAPVLYNTGSLGMKVFITCEQQTDEGLGAVVMVDIYRPALDEWSGFWSGTFDQFELAEPILYGDLDAGAYAAIMFSFQWPESEGDDTETLAGKSLTENIVFTGTTQGVEQP